MLILTRKVDQGIVIAGNIHVRVLGVQRDRVKIGISAPIEIVVLRDELVDGSREGGSQAGAVDAEGLDAGGDEQVLEIDIGETNVDGGEREEPQASES